MALPLRSRPLKKSDFALFLKPLKPTLFTDSPTPNRPSPIPPNIKSVSWSATGALLATCTVANIRVWNTERGPSVKNSVEVKRGHVKDDLSGGNAEQVEKVAFCPTVEGVLASCGHDGMVRLWDVRVSGAVAAGGGKGTPALGRCKVGHEAAFLTWHPSGQEMLVGRKDDVVQSVDVRRMAGHADVLPPYELEATHRLDRGKDILYAMAFSNTGREVFATTNAGTVKILDYPSMDLLHTLSGHPAPCYTVQYSPAGTSVAVGSADSTVSLWDTHTWLTTHSLTAPSQTTSIRDISFSFDGSYLVAGVGTGPDAKDGGPGLNIFHIDTGEVVHTVETTHAPSQVAWHPSRYWVAYAGDAGGVKVVGGLGTGL